MFGPPIGAIGLLICKPCGETVHNRGYRPPARLAPAGPAGPPYTGVISVP